MAIASEGNVPVPTEASRTSMSGLTPFIPTPRGNFAGKSYPAAFVVDLRKNLYVQYLSPFYKLLKLVIDCFFNGGNKIIKFAVDLRDISLYGYSSYNALLCLGFFSKTVGKLMMICNVIFL
ncbi:hypothetical protein Sbal625DRAFT_0675 [Shewanella baltica OS625]|nr:hypothetical protein Sbal625DRAFT_0675 [Shewanella baltica OS625]